MLIIIIIIIIQQMGKVKITSIKNSCSELFFKKSF